MGKGAGKGRGDCCESDEVRWCCGCFGGSVVLTSIILFAVSFSTLEPYEVGLKYNNNLVELEPDRVYNNGRFFLGLGVWFIKFPMSLQTVDVTGNEQDVGALRAWSKEGQELLIDVDFSYRLQRNHIHDIYYRYGDSFNGPIESIAFRVIKQVTTQYTVEDFFVQRFQISNEMRSALRTRLASEWMSLDMFNLRYIAIPSAFETKIIQKVVKAQELQTAYNIALTNTLRARIEVIRGTGDADIAVLIARANAERAKVIEAAKSSGLARLRQQEATSYQLLQQRLGLNATDLLHYRWAQIMSDITRDSASNNMQFLIGFKDGAVRIGS